MELKIKLKVKNKEIELTKEEAQELVETLRDIFGKEKEYIPYYPYTYPWYRPWEVTWCEDNTTYKPNDTITIYSEELLPQTTWTVAYDISDNVQMSYSYS